MPISHADAGGQNVTLRLVEQNEIERMQAEDRVRMKIFATNLAYGTPLVKSMRRAGYERPSKSAAVELTRNSFVREEMERCFEDLRATLRNSREAVVAQLDDAIEMAHNLEQPAAVVAGIVAKAKVLGLMDRAQQGNMPAKITVEWGEESQETIYEKSNPLLIDAVATTVGSEGSG